MGYELVPIKASDIAYSSLLNAMDSLNISIKYLEPISLLMDDTHSSSHGFVRDQLYKSISGSYNEGSNAFGGFNMNAPRRQLDSTCPRSGSNSPRGVVHL